MENGLKQMQVRLAVTDQDLADVQRLRYDVFVEQMGAAGMVDHHARREADQFDDHAAHLMVTDGEQVLAVCRLMDQAAAQSAGGFYSSSEFDLGPLLHSGKSLLEMGRLCLHPDHRGGAVLAQLWAGLADYVAQGGYDLLFGTASFSGSDAQSLALVLSWLHDNHLAPSDICPRSKQPAEFSRISNPDRRAAALALPPLIKAYIRYGGKIGQGAFVDRAFNTVDVLMLLDLATANQAFIRRAMGPKS